MAMTTITPTSLFMPSGYMGGSANAFAMNSTDDWLAWVFYWPGGDLTRCAIMATAVSGSPVVTLQLFDTDATDGGTSPVNTASAIGSAVDSATLVANTPQVITGIGQASLSAGIYALRAIFKSGTSCSILRNYNALWFPGGAVSQFPFAVSVTDGGSQTKIQPQSLSVAVGGSALTFIDGLCPPVQIASTSTFASTSNPDEYGLWFTNPWPCSVRISSVGFYAVANARPDIRLAIYSSGPTSPTQAVAQTFDRDVTGSNSVAGYNWLHLSSANHHTLASGASCGIGLRSATAHNLSLYYMDFKTGNQAIMDSWWGQNAYLFTREGDTGDLTTVTYQTPLIMVMVDGVDAGSSSGGGPLTKPRLVQ